MNLSCKSSLRELVLNRYPDFKFVAVYAPWMDFGAINAAFLHGGRRIQKRAKSLRVFSVRR